MFEVIEQVMPIVEGAIIIFYFLLFFKITLRRTDGQINTESNVQ